MRFIRMGSLTAIIALFTMLSSTSLLEAKQISVRFGQGNGQGRGQGHGRGHGQNHNHGRQQGVVQRSYQQSLGSAFGVDLQIGGYGNGGRISVGVPLGQGGFFLDSFVPNSYGTYRYGYSPYGYRVAIPVYGGTSYYDAYRGLDRTYGNYGHAPSFGAYTQPMDSPLLRPAVGEVRDGGVAREPAAGADAEMADPEELASPAIDPFRTERPQVSTVNQMRRALRSTANGDEMFGNKRYRESQSQYRNAIRTAADLAEPHLHYGIALIASDRYDDAIDELKTAIDYEPEVLIDRLTIDDLYGENQEDKQSHLDKLSEAAIEDPGDGGLLFAIGVWLVLDGQQERAVPLLRQAADLEPKLVGTVDRMRMVLIEDN